MKGIRPAPIIIGIIAAICLWGCSAAAPPPRIENPRISAGRAMMEAGEYNKAENHFTLLMNAADSTGNVLLKAQCAKWLGNIAMNLNQYEKAADRYRESAALLDALIHVEGMKGNIEGEMRDERFNVYSNLASSYLFQGRYDRADSVYRLVLLYDLQQGENKHIANTLNNIGLLRKRTAEALKADGDSTAYRRNLDSAEAHYRRSIATYPTGDAHLNLGTALYLRGDIDQCIEEFQKAQKLFAESGQKRNEALCLGNIGVILSKRERYEEAVTAHEAAIRIVEELRGNVSSVDVRSSFIEDKYYIYEDIISALIKLNRLEEAFQYVERSKARSFLDLLGNKAIGESKNRSPELREMIDEERQLQSRITRLIDNPDSSSLVGSLIRQHQSLLEDLQEADPEYASVKSIEPISVSDLQALLNDTTALMEYYLGSDTSYVFVVRDTGIAVGKVKEQKGNSLASEVESFRRAMYIDFPKSRMRFFEEAKAQQGMTSETARKAWYGSKQTGAWQYQLMGLYGRLVNPVQNALVGVKTLYIVPHGVLHHFPFHALIAGPGNISRDTAAHLPRPRYWIEDVAIAYLPSASVLAFAQTKDAARSDSTLIIGDPVYADPLYRKQPLPGALREADSVARYAPMCVLLKREEAEERTIKAEIRGKNLIHFATHGELNKKDPLKSRILLAAAQPLGENDGNLTVAEVFNLDLDASLVTLSACQTAQLSGEEGKFSSGDDLVGLTRSFMYAGTPSVIASLWYVDDAATLSWMVEFYRHWMGEKRTKIESARHAALALINRPADPDWVVPYFWCAFIYIGAAE